MYDETLSLFSIPIWLYYVHYYTAEQIYCTLYSTLDVFSLHNLSFTIVVFMFLKIVLTVHYQHYKLFVLRYYYFKNRLLDLDPHQSTRTFLSLGIFFLGIFSTRSLLFEYILYVILYTYGYSVSHVLRINKYNHRVLVNISIYYGRMM